MKGKEKATGRLEELDALRGIAALAVLAFHYTMYRDAAPYGFELGVTAVDLFFMISGFVIFMSLKDSLSPLKFMKKRFFRLYPVYWVVVTFTALLIILNFTNKELLPLTPARYVANLTMFHNLFGEAGLDGPYWTMLIEMQFYIIVFVALLFKRVKLIISFGWLIISFLLINELVVQPISPYRFGVIFEYTNFWAPIFGHFPFFFAGIFFYRLYKGEGNAWTYIGIAISFLAALLVFQNFGASRSYVQLPQYVFTTSIYFLIFILFVRGNLGFIVGRGTLFFGQISYALYLIHQFLGIEFIIPYLEQNYHINYRQGALIAFTIAVGLAYLITRYVEKPSIRLGKKVNEPECSGKIKVCGKGKSL